MKKSFKTVVMTMLMLAVFAGAMVGNVYAIDNTIYPVPNDPPYEPKRDLDDYDVIVPIGHPETVITTVEIPAPTPVEPTPAPAPVEVAKPLPKTADFAFAGGYILALAVGAKALVTLKKNK